MTAVAQRTPGLDSNRYRMRHEREEERDTADTMDIHQNILTGTRVPTRPQVVPILPIAKLELTKLKM